MAQQKGKYISIKCMSVWIPRIKLYFAPFITPSMPFQIHTLFFSSKQNIQRQQQQQNTKRLYDDGIL